MTLPDAPRLLRGKVVGSVVRADRPTPRTVRLVVHLPGYAGTTPLAWTDEHVTLADLGRDERTVVTRRCAVRRWDQDALEMTLEIHLHDGPGAELPRWARAYGVGSWVTVLGRHGETRPDPAHDVLLLAGDEAGLPTILRTLEELPEGVSARAFVEVADSAERCAVDLPAGAGLTWVLRGAAYGAELLAAVRAARLPDGSVQACLRAEATLVRSLRRIAVDVHGAAADDVSAVPLWWHGEASGGRWKALREQWDAEVAADDVADDGAADDALAADGAAADGAARDGAAADGAARDGVARDGAAGAR